MEEMLKAALPKPGGTGTMRNNIGTKEQSHWSNPSFKGSKTGRLRGGY